MIKILAPFLLISMSFLALPQTTEACGFISRLRCRAQQRRDSRYSRPSQVKRADPAFVDLQADVIELENRVRVLEQQIKDRDK